MRARFIMGEDDDVRGDPDVEIGAIVYDSRKATQGSLFIALKGEAADGHDFIAQALGNGAAAVVHDRRWKDLPEFLKAFPGRLWIGVEDPRDAMASMSDRFFGRPSQVLTLVGITGTNGKTTTSYLVKSVLERWGRSVGLIGTIGYIIGEETADAAHTTPEAPEFQALLRQMADIGCTHVVAEVSSHGLAQKRVAHTRFQVAVFTNLTRDHLDFHGTMEAYFSAKEQLFTGLLPGDGAAVINLDDPFGERLARIMRESEGIGGCGGPRVLTYAVKNMNADLRASCIESSFRGTSFELSESDGGEGYRGRISSKLVGMTSVYNILAAAGVARVLGVPFPDLRDGIAAAERVKGRFERVDLGQEFLAVVDYAHTEDALERLLLTAGSLRNGEAISETREPCPPASGRETAGGNGHGGRIITVFGCGGNRDRGKRPAMGAVASRLSDLVIVTTDNPRHEDPAAILNDIETGITADNYVVIPDRALAIEMSVRVAAPGDIVVIAGKGHEEYQEVRGIRGFFSDRAVLEEAIARRNARGGTARKQSLSERV